MVGADAPAGALCCDGAGALVRRPKPLSPLSAGATALVPPASAEPEMTDAIRDAAQDFLNTPSGAAFASAGVPADAVLVSIAFGKSAADRSFQVINGATASMRLSVPASISDRAPP